jgi:hypothetical protein
MIPDEHLQVVAGADAVLGLYRGLHDRRFGDYSLAAAGCHRGQRRHDDAVPQRQVPFFIRKLLCACGTRARPLFIIAAPPTGDRLQR